MNCREKKFAILTELAGKRFAGQRLDLQPKTFCNSASWTEAGSSSCSDTMKKLICRKETEEQNRKRNDREQQMSRTDLELTLHSRTDCLLIKQNELHATS